MCSAMLFVMPFKRMKAADRLQKMGVKVWTFSPGGLSDKTYEGYMIEGPKSRIREIINPMGLGFVGAVRIPIDGKQRWVKLIERKLWRRSSNHFTPLTVCLQCKAQDMLIGPCRRCRSVTVPMRRKTYHQESKLHKQFLERRKHLRVRARRQAK
jgi:hypothetical protein